MDNGLIETLLNSEENASLDFKRQQYPFIKASPDNKSELLKDILAFANAWRTSSAYILIGVEEVKGGRSIVHGLGDDDALDDAQLQQFIKAKVNKPIEFSYSVQQFEGKRIGIIEIPVQARPFWIREDFGKVRGKAVYLRRGSSTDQADPDEIVKIAQADTGQTTGDPAITVQWFDFSTRQIIGKCANVRCSQHAEPEKPWPGAASRTDFGGGQVLIDPMTNNDYWREVADYLWAQRMFQPLHLCLANNSTRLSQNTRLVLKIDKSTATVIPESKLPAPPMIQRFGRLNMRHVPGMDNPAVTDLGDCWEIEFEMGSIQPKARHHSHTPFYFAGTQSQQAEFTATVYADNIGEPQESKLSLDIEVEQLPALTMADLEAYDEDSDDE